MSPKGKNATKADKPPSLISSFLRGEAKRTICVYIYGHIHTQSGMQKADQAGMMYKMYHGNESYPSQITKLLSGEPPYTHIYEERAVTQNETNATNLVLKETFATKEKERLIQPGTHITRAVLETVSFSSNNLVPKRNIFSTAQGAMAKLRKMVSILCRHYKDGQPTESGMSIDDVHERTLDDLWKMEKGATATVESIDTDDEETQEENTAAESTAKKLAPRPTNWRPDCWMPLLVFGPTAPKEDQLNLLLQDDPVDDGNKKKRGRQASRDAKKAQDDADRKTDTTGSRGVSVSDRIGIAGLALQRKEIEQNRKQDMQLARYQHAQRLTDAVTQHMRFLELLGQDSPDRSSAMQRLNRAIHERDTFNAKMASQLFEDECNTADTQYDGVDDVIAIVSPNKKQKKSLVLRVAEKDGDAAAEKDVATTAEKDGDERVYVCPKLKAYIHYALYLQAGNGIDLRTIVHQFEVKKFTSAEILEAVSQLEEDLMIDVKEGTANPSEPYAEVWKCIQSPSKTSLDRIGKFA